MGYNFYTLVFNSVANFGNFSTQNNQNWAERGFRCNYQKNCKLTADNVVKQTATSQVKDKNYLFSVWAFDLLKLRTHWVSKRHLLPAKLCK